MKVLVVGSGGREHTLCWKISQSKEVEKVYCAPGNGGTRLVAENVDIKANDIDALVEFALKNNIDLTVVGPEEPLVTGNCRQVPRERTENIWTRQKMCKIGRQ